MMTFAIAAMSLALLDPLPVPRPVEATQPAPAVKSTPTADTRYCTQGTPTGSILRVRTCRTRAEWLDLGFDPLARR